MHHLQSMLKRHCGKRVCLIPDYSHITTWNLLTCWKKPLICSQPDWSFFFCTVGALMWRASLPWIRAALGLTWQMRLTGLLLLARRSCAEDDGSFVSSASTRTNRHGECKHTRIWCVPLSSLPHTLSLSNKYGKSISAFL